jgi:HD-GYP domain-containing protein (c-di-GMP phosphodiesterase class II)
MTSDRPYRRALSMDAVCDEIERFKGSQFDPGVADCFLEIAEREGDGFLERTSKFDLDCFLGDIGDRT